VPKLKTFLLQNHDLMKVWFEDQLEPLSQRMYFPLRILRFTATICILFIITYAMIDPQDAYF
jgi:hypothetical protein